MDNKIMCLTPKKKSILWKYLNDNSILVYAMSRHRSLILSSNFALDEENLKQNVKKAQILAESRDSCSCENSCVLRGDIAIIIWEMCNGTNTIKDIIQQIINEYKVDYDVAASDCIDFLKDCDVKNIMDLHWRSIV